MSTNIERAAEVLRRALYFSTDTTIRGAAEALAAEGLLVTEGKVCPYVGGDPEGTSYCTLKNVTDEQQRLIRLGKAVEKLRVDLNEIRLTNERMTTVTPRQATKLVLDAIYAEAERDEQ